MEYYSNINRNEVLNFHVIMLKDHDHTLNEKVSYKRPHVVWFHLHGMSNTGTCTDRSAQLVARENMGREAKTDC